MDGKCSRQKIIPLPLVHNKFCILLLMTSLIWEKVQWNKMIMASRECRTRAYAQYNSKDDYLMWNFDRKTTLFMLSLFSETICAMTKYVWPHSWLFHRLFTSMSHICFEKINRLSFFMEIWWFLHFALLCLIHQMYLVSYPNRKEINIPPHLERVWFGPDRLPCAHARLVSANLVHHHQR